MDRRGLIGVVPGFGPLAGRDELPVAFDHSEVSGVIPVVDSNRVLARARVDTSFAVRRAGRMLVPAR